MIRSARTRIAMERHHAESGCLDEQRNVGALASFPIPSPGTPKAETEDNDMTRDTESGKRRLRFSRFGITEDPRRAIGISAMGACSCGREPHPFDITDVRYEYTRGAFMLGIRHFNGESHPEIGAGAIYVYA